MAHYADDEATPRAFRVLSPDEWDARSPYIPRRKSSHNEGSVHAVSVTNVTRRSRAQQDKNIAQDHPVQKARFPIDGYDPPLGQALHQIPLQRGSELRRPQPALKQSSSRRFLTRLFSNLPFPSNASRPLSTHPNASDSKLSRTHCRSESMTSSCASSTLSVSTGASLSPYNTVRRRRQLALTSVRTPIPDSTNPLRVPPPSLLGPTQDNCTVSETTESNCSPIDSMEGFLDTPTVAYGQLKYLTLAGNNSSKNTRFWVIIDILCSLNQSANQESLGQEQRAHKFFNSPGLLKGVTLTLSTLQNCQITTILGQCTAATLAPEQTFTVIILVTLHKSFLPSMRPSPQKENGRSSPSSSRRRPTSEVLNDELLNQLLGKFKRAAQAKDEKTEERILRAVVTYEHSLFPPGHGISHEQTVTVERARIGTRPQDASPKRKQKQDRGSPHGSAVKKLNTQETQDAGERIIRVLREGLRLDGSTTEAASHPTVDASQAVKLLNDFLAAATRLAPNTNRTLEMLKFRYSMLTNSSDGGAAAQKITSPNSCNHFDRREGERHKSFELGFHKRISPNAESKDSRRNAFEIDREKGHLQQGLADITNRTRRRACDLLSRGAHLVEYDVKTDIGRYNAIPAPLFSPRRGLTLVPSAGTNSPMHSGARTPEEEGFYGSRHPLTTRIGAASFYAAEVEQMARQAFGGATTPCYRGGEFLHQSTEKDEVAGAHPDTIEADGNDKAKMIWERMRICSEGSGTSAKGTELSSKNESGDEAERARECKVLGAPWLA